MGKRREKYMRASQTLPSSPSHSFSSSSSDFEFTMSLSPRKSSINLCPADDLFYKGQLLPLHLSPRISMVRTLTLASSSISSSSDTTTTASRDSTGSTESSSSFTSDLVLLRECDSSRPSSVAEDDEFKRLSNYNTHSQTHLHISSQIKKSSKYFSLSRFSSVFKKETNKNQGNENVSGNSPVKRMSSTAKEVIRKYLKKVKPLYEKLSQKQQPQKMEVVRAISKPSRGCSSFSIKPERSTKDVDGRSKNISRKVNNGGFSSIPHSFSGNLRYPKRRSCVSSCPSSMRSSPSHSGVLSVMGSGTTSRVNGGAYYYGDTSSMEELQSAIQGAIAHCKNSLIQSKTLASNEI
ncbi:hypothetical protein K2173_022371 [Erythroxylum novogranatense]|uniref:Membrane-associated kinase regulator 1 n=1 Tax=Erythroxylum novogranatense TaxID=1862640 RepID=A0AAV8THF2_9ROSI|nr:hypothetical protein K2173_022371 [Erythroxylum novogranatense]